MDAITIVVREAGPDGSAGLTLTFKELSFWDAIQAQNEAVDGNGRQNDQKYLMALAWRSAIAGGYSGSFQAFCQAIPMRKMKAVLEAIGPFMVEAPHAGEAAPASS